MHSARVILTAGLLTVFALQMVGGQAVHLWHCPTHGHEVVHRANGTDAAHHGHAHGPCGHSVDGARQDDERSPRDDHRHDSSKCRTCKILGQAQHKSLDVSLVESTGVFADAISDAPNLYLAHSSDSYHSRAPPTASPCA